MKKHFIIWACAIAALLFTACQKEKAAASDTPAEGSAAEMNVITATALDTKTTTPDDVHVYWENTDAIALFAVNGTNRTRSANYSTSQSGASATFTKTNDTAPIATEIEGNNYYFALYPSSSLNKWASSMVNAGTRRVYFNLPKEQTAVVGGWDKKAMILASESTTSSFQFKHIVSYIKFTVDGASSPFVKMTITAKSGESLTGDNIAAKYQESSIAYDPSYTSGTYYSSATIEKSDKSAFTSGTYYVAVLPGSYSKGLAFTFENQASKVCFKSSPKNVVLEGGQVADLGTVGTLNFADPAGAFVPYLYAESGVNKGVVFWRDPFDPTKGLAVSGVYASTIKWHISASTFDDAASFDKDDSQANRDYIISKDDYSEANYPAVAFCENLGSGWRLPSKNEFDEVVRAWTGYTGELTDNMKFETDDQLAAQAEFDALLSNFGNGNKLAVGATTWYWTGQAYGDTKKIRRTKIASTYYPGNASATTSDKTYVRCIRDVQIQ